MGIRTVDARDRWTIIEAFRRIMIADVDREPDGQLDTLEAAR